MAGCNDYYWVLSQLDSYSGNMQARYSQYVREHNVVPPDQNLPTWALTNTSTLATYITSICPA